MASPPSEAGAALGHEREPCSRGYKQRKLDESSKDGPGGKAERNESGIRELKRKTLGSVGLRMGVAGQIAGDAEDRRVQEPPAGSPSSPGSPSSLKLPFSALDLQRIGLEGGWLDAVLQLPDRFFSREEKAKMNELLSSGQFPSHQIAKFVKATKDVVDMQVTLEKQQASLAHRLRQEMTMAQSQPSIFSPSSQGAKKLWQQELERACELRRSVISKLRGLGASTTEDLVRKLSTPGEMIKLALPAAERSGHAPCEEYTYLPRACFRDLLCMVAALGTGVLSSHLQFECTHKVECLRMDWASFRECYFIGTPGSGKSVTLATAAALLLSLLTDTEIVPVYLLAEVYVTEPYNCLRRALLLSFAGHEAICNDILLQDDNDLAVWCKLRRGGFIFLIDEHNAFDIDKSSTLPFKVGEHRSMLTDLELIVKGNLVVRCSSVNLKVTKCVKSFLHVPRSLELNGSFTPPEMEEWHKAHPLPCDHDEHYYTGNIPRFLHIWHSELQKGDHQFIYRYKSRLKSCVGRLKNYFMIEARQEDMNSVVKFLTGAYVESDEWDNVPRNIFYIENCTGRFLCPYLRNVAYKFLLQRETSDRKLHDLADFQMWRNALHLDIRVDNVNWPRLGWNSEAATILAICKHGFVLVDYGRLRVNHLVTFSSGQEVQALAMKREDGTLFVPEQFNHEHIDLLYMKQTKENQWLLVGIQISVSLYDVKARKRSHEKWVAHATLVNNMQFKFLYMLRGASQLLSTLHPTKTLDFKAGVKVVHEEYELCFGTFGSVHSDLSILDRLHLNQPVSTAEVECKSILNSDSRKGEECGRIACKIKGHVK